MRIKSKARATKENKGSPASFRHLAAKTDQRPAGADDSLSYNEREKDLEK